MYLTRKEARAAGWEDGNPFCPRPLLCRLRPLPPASPPAGWELDSAPSSVPPPSAAGQRHVRGGNQQALRQHLVQPPPSLPAGTRGRAHVCWVRRPLCVLHWHRLQRRVKCSVFRAQGFLESEGKAFSLSRTYSPSP